MKYSAYISSRDWRRNPARLAELEAAGHRCRTCNKGRDEGVVIEVHHRTYANLGNEQPGDLTALCRDCHRGVTNGIRQARYANRRPLFANVRAVLEPTPLFDPTYKECL